ncbi:MAG: CPBP family intramembrane metalloprotease [Methanobrevibacter sp.]|jgi:membrane protease YdiL (CAAX protease family)|nr:CPBP family intramembrane metalloprotease [Candidatus Methanoflexus mossambicus]
MNLNKKNKDNERFKFERPGLDFPLYKDNIPLKKWIVAILVIIGVFVTTFIPINLFIIRGPLVCLIPLLGYGYLSNFNYKKLLAKFQKKDVLVIIILYIAYLGYGAIMNMIFLKLGVVHLDTNLTNQNITSPLYFCIYLIQLLGEELFRTLTFLFVLTMVYKYLSRKIAIIIGLFVSSIIFGLLHYEAYGSLLQIILIQGLGISFLTLGYIKTKNIAVSYIIHFIVDTMGFISVFMTHHSAHTLINHTISLLMALL